MLHPVGHVAHLHSGLPQAEENRRLHLVALDCRRAEIVRISVTPSADPDWSQMRNYSPEVALVVIVALKSLVDRSSRAGAVWEVAAIAAVAAFAA